MQPRNEKSFTVFSKADSNVVESAAILVAASAVLTFVAVRRH
jgi:hypothetical protein